MKFAKDRNRDDLLVDLVDGLRFSDRYLLPQTLMGPGAIEVELGVLLQNLCMASYKSRCDRQFVESATTGLPPKTTQRGRVCVGLRRRSAVE